MATGQDLRHDFAPAWLKLPNSETAKQHASVKCGERSLDHSIIERSNWTGWYRYGNGGAVAGGAAVDRSGRSGLDDIGYSPHQQHLQPRRPRFYSTDHPADHIGSYNADVHRSHVKHGGGNGHAGRYDEMVNGTGTASDSCIGNGFRTATVNGSSYSPTLKYNGAGSRVSSSQSRNNVRRTKSVRDEAVGGSSTGVASLDDEFPSLNGDSHAEDRKTALSRVHTVWDSPCREPNNAVRSPCVIASDSTYKALVLKTGMVKRVASECDRSTNRPLSSTTSSLALKTSNTPTTRDSPKEIQSIVGDVLSTCVVKQPKNLGDKKSNFLKALRRHESEVLMINGGDGRSGCHMSASINEKAQSAEQASVENEKMSSNGVEYVENGDDKCRDSAPNDAFHPGFTEAEYKLLLEMGWKEPADDDEDGYEITDDDVREFENLRFQLKSNKLNSPATPQRNGFTHSTAIKSLSSTPNSALSTSNNASLFTFTAEIPLPCLESGFDEASSNDEDSVVDPN